MDIQTFITFREVARCLNFTRAAERLGYAQPTITVQIQKLELEFNIHLFERNGKALKLTTEGTKLLQYADRIVDAYMEAMDRFTTPPAGYPNWYH
jgi:DNA-binding transcriptional LysR family regulator